jgi:hypothetical protein
MIIEDSNLVDSNAMNESASVEEVGNQSVLESTNVLKSKEQEYNERKINNSALSLDWGCVFTFF